MRKWFVLLLLVFVFVAVGCEKDEGDSLEKVSVVLEWTPNTNHTGIYVAKEKGYFEAEGLDVEIIMPGEAGSDQLVAAGKAEFGVSYQESITLARTEEVPLVSLAAIIQHNTSGFASPVDKNITSPKDFEGKTYGGWGSPVEKSIITSLMQKENADVDKVSMISIGDTDFFTAVKRDIDFAWIYYGWTGIEAELRGEEINMVYLTDYSEQLDYYTPVLMTNENMIAKQSDVVEKFVRAVAKGYDFTIQNSDEAADILLKAVPDLDEALVKASVEWLADKYQDDAPRWGEQKLSVWQNYADWMFENNLLEKELEAEKAFTNEFLPK